MSSPYIYNQRTTAAQYPYQYQNTPYYHSPRVSTPFIPDLNLYHGSPYSNPPSLPPSPHINSGTLPISSSAVPFPLHPDDDYIPWTPYVRERRPSWHAHNPRWINPPSPSVYPIGVPIAAHRRHSFGSSSYPFRPALSSYSTASDFYINPWLNAEVPRTDFIFDLSSTAYSPVRIYGLGQVGPLSQDELLQPATHPPITRLRILCDLIPQWPIDLQPNAYMGASYPPPPISLQDILIAIHRHMQKQISHADWAKLDRREEIAVGQAYTARCRAAQSITEHELAQGVKRVDFLLGSTKFVGLVRQLPSSDGWEVMKLHLRN